MAFCQPTDEIKVCSMGIRRNWPKELAAPEMPKAQERRSGGAARPMMPLTAPKPVHASPRPINTPEPRMNKVGSLTTAIHTSPAIYATAPTSTTRIVPKRSATMPASGPKAPHIRFCSAIASEYVSRLQPLACEMGCIQKPKPCRTPIARVSTTPLAISTVFRSGARWLVNMAVSVDQGRLVYSKQQLQISRRPSACLVRVVHDADLPADVVQHAHQRHRFVQRHDGAFQQALAQAAVHFDDLVGVAVADAGRVNGAAAAVVQFHRQVLRIVEAAVQPDE